jgi:site-specific recombinase XerC
MLVTRLFHELFAATLDMAVLPGVLGRRLLRRTVQVRLGTNPAARGTVTRWPTHLHGLATSTHETTGLAEPVTASRCYLG